MKELTTQIKKEIHLLTSDAALEETFPTRRRNISDVRFTVNLASTNLPLPERFIVLSVRNRGKLTKLRALTLEEVDLDELSPESIKHLIGEPLDTADKIGAFFGQTPGELYNFLLESGHLQERVLSVDMLADKITVGGFVQVDSLPDKNNKWYFHIQRFPKRFVLVYTDTAGKFEFLEPIVFPEDAEPAFSDMVSDFISNGVIPKISVLAQGRQPRHDLPELIPIAFIVAKMRRVAGKAFFANPILSEVFSFFCGKEKPHSLWLFEQLRESFCINDFGELCVVEKLNSHPHQYLRQRWIIHANVHRGRFFYQFNDFVGNFYCDFMELERLAGCPRKVHGYFSCENNKLVDLQGGPQVVGRGYTCANNQLESLAGSPATIFEDFDCSGNLLQSLENGPQQVKGSYSCHKNKLRNLVGITQKIGQDLKVNTNALESLVGSPKMIYGNFICNNTRLKSLEGCPLEVGGNFNCSNNKLENLLYGPEFVAGNYDASNNKLRNLDGLAEHITGNLILNDNPLLEIKEDVSERIDGNVIAVNKAHTKVEQKD